MIRSIRRPRLGGLWRHAAFVRLWSASIVSGIGSAVTALALPLLAALALGASELEVGLLAAAETAPLLLLGLVAGAWLDRRARRPVMIAADLARAALLLLIPLAAWLGLLRIELLLVVAFLVGTLTVFFDVASQAFLPTLLKPDELVEGNGKLYAGYGVADVAGPGLAGALIQVLSAPVAVVVDAVSFVFSAALLRGIDAPEPLAAPADGARSLRREIGEGLRAVAVHPILRTLAASTGLWNLFENARRAMLVLFLARELRLDAAAIGVVFTTGSAGFLVGSLIPVGMARRFGLGRAIVGGVAATLPGSLLIPLAGGPAALAGAMVALGFALEGLAAPTYDVNQFSLRQSLIPSHLQGRVAASTRVLIRGTVPLGALLGGLLATAIGLRGVMWVGALGAPIALAVVWFSPVRAMRRLPEREE